MWTEGWNNKNDMRHFCPPTLQHQNVEKGDDDLILVQYYFEVVERKCDEL